MSKKKVPWHSKREFLALRKEWYDKLEDEGFQDIENHDWRSGEAQHLFKSTGSPKNAFEVQRRYSPDKQRYFELARQDYQDMLRDPYKYSLEEREIMSLWSEGMRMAEIGRKMGLSVRKVKKVVQAAEDRFLPRRGADILPFPERDSQ